ncbi:hypothetical protein [Aquisphaera insulae]|uniref:hypothetical protein n=1 Tax=Aquisphaera insulae TaxID=2712864 RepID=UPI0013EC17B6|nr:hypothetical protein [Aquisphaera insulae]
MMDLPGLFIAPVFHFSDLNGSTTRRVQFGDGAGIPIVGDWTGTGIDMPGLKIGAIFHFGNMDGSTIRRVQFGDGPGTPVVGDWDGTGTDKPGLKIGAIFHLGDMNGRTIRRVQFGDGPGTPIVGDWDGTGTDKPGLLIGSTFHLGDMNGRTIRRVQFGDGVGTPVVGDWDGTGTDKPGLLIGSTFHLGDMNGRTIRRIRFGDGIGTPVVGDWMTSNFTFDADISAANRARLIDRHRFAIGRIGGCNNLSAAERESLFKAYQKPIRHSTLNEPGINARATIGGSHLQVNFGVLFPQGNTEISQTLIHEMMHSAGFTHPDRRDPPTGMSCASPNPSLFDCPFDNGQYYGTPPLRAELCIAGSQSLALGLITQKAGQERCSINADGVATLYTEFSDTLEVVGASDESFDTLEIIRASDESFDTLEVVRATDGTFETREIDKYC